MSLLSTWVEAGQSEARFWNQTPRSYSAVLRGVNRRLKAEAEARTAQAYEAGAFAGLAHHGKLKALKHYTSKQRTQSPREMAAMIQALGAKSNMKIRRIGE